VPRSLRLRRFARARSASSAGRRRAIDLGPVPVLADEAARERVREQAWRRLRRVLAEAVILQDAADELLETFRDRPALGEVAPPCGRLKGRFVELAEHLPASDDPVIAEYAAVVRSILGNHVYMLKSSVDLLVAGSASARVAEELDEIVGLGAPARRLDAIRTDVLARAMSSGTSTATDT
jgi:hypothetical protein